MIYLSVTKLQQLSFSLMPEFDSGKYTISGLKNLRIKLFSKSANSKRSQMCPLQKAKALLKLSARLSLKRRRPTLPLSQYHRR
jgi:hypothetical protein